MKLHFLINFMRWKTFPDKNLVNVLMHINCQGQAVDVGCGSGADALYLANSGFEKVLAIDKDESQILDEVKYHPNIDVIEDDYENVIKNKKFDFICSRCSAFFIDQIKLLINALKNNGCLFLKTFADKISKQDLKKLVFKYEHSLKQSKVKENHPPLGEHTHDVLLVVMRKKKKER